MLHISWIIIHTDTFCQFSTVKTGKNRKKPTVPAKTSFYRCKAENGPPRKWTRGPFSIAEIGPGVHFPLLPCYRKWTPPVENGPPFTFIICVYLCYEYYLFYIKNIFNDIWCIVGVDFGINYSNVLVYKLILENSTFHYHIMES